MATFFRDYDDDCVLMWKNCAVDKELKIRTQYEFDRDFNRGDHSNNESNSKINQILYKSRLRGNSSRAAKECENRVILDRAEEIKVPRT